MVKFGDRRLPKRFWNKVKIASNGCWEWQGGLGRGYGIYVLWNKELKKSRTVVAHRFLYKKLIGKFPEHYEVDHLCINRKCCNPEHLEPVPHSVNINRSPQVQAHRKALKARTHCPQGHPYSGDNLKINKKGARVCLTCNTAPYRKIREEKREIARVMAVARNLLLDSRFLRCL